MQTSTKILSLVLGSLLFISCQKEIEFKGEILAPMVVVNSYVSPDSAIYVHLTKSKFFLSSEDGFDYIDNAEVFVFVNRIFKEKLNLKENGLYTGNLKPLIGDTIKLVIDVEDYDHIESTTIIQSRANILSVDTTTVTYTDMYYSEEIMYFNMKIQDQVDEKNYYRLTTKIRTETISGDSLYINEAFIHFNLEGLDNQSGSLFDLFGNDMSSNDHYLITDELFNGKEFVFKLSTNISYRGSQDNVEPGDIGVNDENTFFIINLQTISKDMYLYLRSRKSAEGIFEGVFTEPVQIFNNITNGVGIFGTYTNNEYKFKL